ncbi:YjbF family lipoprotein [Halomonas daqiaonensis]|uniref:Group 4 capsule polysaccharide lipoprotein gfcB, YjbF n=1 Tax=Halomonas daqiaonensis TaxID=650850 RepID=A0A1H7GSA0_9GAMM|nr:YjbF family lipoprotein [Halomonas daqiaonensis]SEK40367.1 Group 4 capsule polysaccharide lipoprotein gfcB, YjbF [Halomonas daqiaonensis]
MYRRSKTGNYRDRLRAVLLCALPLLLVGCASSGATPLGASLQALWPTDDRISEQAASVPHATLSARLGDVQGLLVMGAQVGDISYWPSRGGGVLELHDGGLHATAGLPEDLLGTHYGDALPWRQDAPYPFTLVRHWRDSGGEVRRGEASGEMRCADAERVELPLGKRALERCEASLTWPSGKTTSSTFWRDPVSRHLWAVRESPWPGAPTMQWQVARHWW